MTAFNFFSHGSQDAYPRFFLGDQHHFDTHLRSLITAIGNVGAICGGVLFGFLSQRLGRRRTIVLAASLALPLLPLWAFSATPLMLGLGAFLMQIAVQGAWGVIPAHLNELSPPDVRGTFPGLVYQLGNLLASANLNLQVSIAAAHGGQFSVALALVVSITALVIIALVAFGPERRDVSMICAAVPVSAGVPPAGAPLARAPHRAAE